MKAHDVRRRNIAAVVRALASWGPKPRAELAEMLSVSPGTVTRIAAELSAAGLLHELPAEPSPDVGRRRIPLQLRADAFAAVGVHIGLLHTTVALVGLRGSLIGSPLEVPHGSSGPRDVLAGAADAADRLAAGHRVRIVGTGICAGGRIDPGSTLFTSVDALGWREIDVAELAADRFPPPLLADSSQRALARAEMRFGGARDTPGFVHLFIGNVIGAGLVLGNGSGEVHLNGRGHGHGNAYGHGCPTGRKDPPEPRAANVAHLPLSRPSLRTCECGRSGCLTSVAGDQALCARAQREGFTATRTLKHLVQQSRAGDRAADYLLRDRARSVGEAVAALFDLLAPDRVFISGSPLLVPAHLAEVRSEAARRTQAPLDAERVIVPSALDRHIRVVSAATCVLEHFYDDPARALNSPQPPHGDPL